MSTPSDNDDEFLLFVVSSVANAAHPIVKQWQDTKHYIHSQNDTPASDTVSAALLDALERSMVDLYAALPTNTSDKPCP